MLYRDIHVAWLRLDPSNDDFFHRVDSLAEAQGILFRCPVCERKGRRGHHVICWNPSVPQDVPPRPGRWALVGTGVGDLSLVAGSSSVKIDCSCKAHFFITDGCVKLA